VEEPERERGLRGYGGGGSRCLLVYWFSAKESLKVQISGHELLPLTVTLKVDNSLSKDIIIHYGNP
ncbi:MAG: hypothetical protein AAB544_05860, partial [Patescibacteria group bacterium]